MTDDLSRDLESIAGTVPAMPNDYAYLRSLIQTLPSPLAPELRAAQAGATASADPEAAAAKMAASLIGGAPGTESGATVGVVSELFYGNSNLLTNPLLDVTDPTGDNFATTDTPFAADWQGKYVLNSGSAPDNGSNTDSLYGRTATNDNPMNSKLMEMYLGTSTTGATDFSAYIYPTSPWGPGIDSALPYLVASVKVSLWGISPEAHCTKLWMRMEIVDDTGVTAGPWLDLTDRVGDWTVYRLSAARPRPSAGWFTASVAPYLWRLRIDYAYDQAEAGGIWDWFTWGEPALALASTQSPPPFSPIIAKWSPNYVEGYAFGDTEPRMKLTTDGLRLGSGSATLDVHLSRLAAATLKIGNNGTSGDESLAIGDDSILFDVDQADRLGICGQTAGAPNVNGGFVFGSGKDTNLYRNGSSSLKTDDQFIVGVTGMANKDNLLIPDTTAGAGLTIGGDASLYRRAASKLATSADFYIGTDSQDRWLYFPNGGGINFGLAGAVDTNLYRGAANILRTDDTIRADAMLPVVDIPNSGDTTTISATSTWYKCPNLVCAITPAYVGQPWLITANAGGTLNAAWEGVFTTRVDNDTSGTAIQNVTLTKLPPIANGKDFVGTLTGVWIADRTSTVYVYLLVETQVGTGTFTWYASNSPYATKLIAIPLA